MFDGVVITTMQAQRRHALIRALYIATVFASAALLFVVQPMFTKMVLPRLGGAPAVWSVAMVFFQATLLAGYAYAHGLIRLARPQVGLAIHIAVMIGAVFALPLAIAQGWGAAPQRGEAFWLLGLFAASIGLPFFALSASAPLLQAWFARTDHPRAANPYFLYAASNVGSFLALISYPLAVEPLTRLTDQSRAWSAGFCVLILLMAACGVVFVRAGRAHAAIEPQDAAAPPPPARRALAWVVLAAVPAGLLVAVTAHISTDIGAVPLLWVVPLALYLATFVIVFQAQPIIPHRLVLVAQPFFLVALVVTLVLPVAHSLLVQIAINLVAFFVIALACHGELAKRRPPAEHLTAFYLWMSAGGMVGGLCAALLAPLVFNWIAEYPLLIVLAALCRPGLSLPLGRREWTLIACAAALALYLAAPALGFGFDVDERTFQIVVGGLLLLALLVELFAWQAPLAFAGLIAIAFMLARVYEPDAGRYQTVRSFFGVLKVMQTVDNKFRVLMHGTTIHGAERMADIAASGEHTPEPLTYYHANSALTRALEAARARKGEPMRIAVVGLGTGTFVCWTHPGDRWEIYEIDPAVVRITAEQKRFTFVARCTPQAPIIMGDARLKLAEAPDGAYDFIMVDAFSSDTIPIHLLTREAMAIYLAKLAPHGMIVMHVSNRHLELSSVVAGIAQANGLTTRTNPGTGNDEHEDDVAYKFTSTIVIAARADEDFGVLGEPGDFAWPVVTAPPKQRIWTDDYSNIVGAILRHLR